MQYKSNHIKVTGAVLTALLLILPIACNDSASGPENDNITGVMVAASGCKTYEMGKAAGDIPADQSCILYEYAPFGKLYITHYNAGFNCCTDVDADVSVSDGVITITEKESGDYCHCLCLFDIEMEISQLPAKGYTVRIIELYRNADDNPIEFTIDLDEKPTGSVCVDRDYYPWGIYIFGG